MDELGLAHCWSDTCMGLADCTVVSFYFHLENFHNNLVKEYRILPEPFRLVCNFRWSSIKLLYLLRGTCLTLRLTLGSCVLASLAAC